MTILISATFRGELLIRGRHLFQCKYPKVRRLLEGSGYLRINTPNTEKRNTAVM